MKYRFTLAGDFLDVFSEASRADRELISRILRKIANTPELLADVEGLVVEGRECMVFLEAGWTFIYWLDHPVREVRFVGLERVT